MSEQAYQLVIFRRDGNHLKITESEDFDKTKELWKSLNKKWEEAFKESKAFIVEDPVVTSFDPGLIYEISILPSVAISKKEHNPYKKAMMEEGFGNRNLLNQANSVLKDNGYI